jgi:uncharacterized OsmC-like protein
MGRQEDTHTLILDRPVATGGTGLGFNGGHLLLLGWGGCFKSTLLAAAESRGLPVSDLHLDIEGVTTETTPSAFETLRMRVRMKGPTPDEQDRLVRLAERWCIVSNTLASACTLEVIRAPDQESEPSAAKSGGDAG